MLRIKRIYEPPAAADGYRILVDRLWPRGLSKEKAVLDEWLKDIAPTPELRTWFGHDPARFAEFRARYQTELESNPAVATLQKLMSKHPTITLLYGAHDTEHNQAVVLCDFLAKS
jgi:uncharacterized protein YeaO (DUF488 family)